MAGHARYTALLDACVLYPQVTMDSLLSLAAAGLYAAKWTRRIEAEWVGALEKNRPDLKGRLDRRRDGMREAVPDWEVEERAWRALEGGISLPDANDRHVLAAAIAGHADCIVTSNLADFPGTITSALAIEVLHPDVFVLAQWDLDPMTSIAAFKCMRARWTKPQATAADFAAAFERGGLPMTGLRLRETLDLI